MRDFFIELTDLTQTDVLNFCILHSVSFSSGNVRDLSLYDILNGNW